MPKIFINPCNCCHNFSCSEIFCIVNIFSRMCCMCILCWIAAYMRTSFLKVCIIMQTAKLGLKWAREKSFALWVQTFQSGHQCTKDFVFNSHANTPTNLVTSRIPRDISGKECMDWLICQIRNHELFWHDKT
jgi:hypothetical protein